MTYLLTLLLTGHLNNIVLMSSLVGIQAFFDIPYLVNRINRMLGESYVKRLSPWGMIDRQDVTKDGKDSNCL